MKTTRLVLIVICALGLLALSGCGCGKLREVTQAVKMANDARDGKVTVTNDKGEKATIETSKDDDKSGHVTVTGPEGSTTKSEWGEDTVKAEDVGIDFYPGAKVEHGGTSTSSGGKDGGGTFSMVALATDDSFDAVGKFYKDKYAKGNTVIEQPNHLMITIQAGENSGKMIMVMPDDDDKSKTHIVISAGGKQ